MPDALGPQPLDDLADLVDAGLSALLAHVDRDAEPGCACGLDERCELAVRIPARARAGAGDVDADDSAVGVAHGLVDDDRVLLVAERPIHHQDEPGADERDTRAARGRARGSRP